MNVAERDVTAEKNIGPYRMIKSLGAGAYGDISLYEADGRVFAIKRMSLLQAQQTMTEISLYNLLSHPHILKPYQLITSNSGHTYNLVMKATEGSLDDMVKKKGRLDERTVRMLLRQLLSALDYLHTNDIYHGDIKPGNILHDDLYLYLIDFGLSSYLRLKQKMYPRSQTITYRAPEIWSGTGHGLPADMFAVGMVLYTLVTGRDLLRFLRNDSDHDIPDIVAAQQVIEAVERGKSDIQRLAPTLLPLYTGLVERDPAQRLTAEGALKMLSPTKYTRPEPVSFPIVKHVDTGLRSRQHSLVTSTGITFRDVRYTEALLSRGQRYLASLEPDVRKYVEQFYLRLSHQLHFEGTDVTPYDIIVKNKQIDPRIYAVTKMFQAIGSNIFIDIQ